MACPWLIWRFIDPQADFVFLPHNTDWSKISDGIVYDVPHCELGHHGEDVSFDSIIRKYKLDDPALRLLAEIVRAADSRPAQPHPAGEGLRWIAHGFSALGLTDHEILNREFVVYDALYAECRRQNGAALQTTEKRMNRKRILIPIAAAILFTGCQTRRAAPVTVYVSEDQVFSEPVLKDFERDTGIPVKAVFDSEEAKSTG